MRTLVRARVGVKVRVGLGLALNVDVSDGVRAIVVSVTLG